MVVGNIPLGGKPETAQADGQGHIYVNIEVALGAGRQFEASGLQRAYWKNATPIRLIFRDACANAGVPYFNPHCVRNTLVQLAERLCKTPEEFKAWSQRLGHEKRMTIFRRTDGDSPSSLSCFLGSQDWCFCALQWSNF